VIKGEDIIELTYLDQEETNLAFTGLQHGTRIKISHIFDANQLIKKKMQAEARIQLTKIEEYLKRLMLCRASLELKMYNMIQGL